LPLDRKEDRINEHLQDTTDIREIVRALAPLRCGRSPR
jgi:hypothetical protein